MIAQIVNRPKNAGHYQLTIVHTWHYRLIAYLWACTMHAGIKDRDVANIAKMTDIT